MYSKQLYLVTFFLICTVSLSSQECNHTLSGTVVDADSGSHIPFASIFIKDQGKGTISGEDGTFSLSHMCGEKCQLIVSFMGYRTIEQTVNLKSNTELIITLCKLNHQLDDVQVIGRTLSASRRETQQLTTQTISQDANKNLANMLQSLTGVSTLKSGGGISKPVVQGLYGSRLPILNNGLTQSGQQWGNDHSPEIDPLVANSISVLSGVEALQYQGASLGSMILVKPGAINRTLQLNGQGSYFFQSNGLGHGLNLQLQQYSSKLGWKINGTLKRSGDQRSAHYFLTNTGIGEANLALQLEKELTDKWRMDAYLSSFNTSIGILRGSHIGNLTDLEDALQRDQPFYTSDRFSYAIHAPRQLVNHHLAKLRVRYFTSNENWLSLTYGGQINKRQEFDVRKGGRSDTPAMNLLQTTHYFEGKYLGNVWRNYRLVTGMQFNFVDNTNDPETGILPLIPDYYSYKTGLFATLSKQVKRLQIEFGGRYDFHHQKVAAISFSVPRTIQRFTNNFANLKLGIDTRFQLTPTSNISAGINYASRNPEVNELYSNGLHQGVGGIEEGDPLLQKEKALKGNLTFYTAFSRKIEIESAFYYQHIDNYIFLNPQDEIRLTIRGAFPVFKYEQTNAHIYGVDLSAHYHLTSQLRILGQYSYLKGHDVSQNIPLINMPSNNLYSALQYHFKKVASLKKFSLEVNQRYVFKQSHLLPSQDYVLPPDAYNLIGIKVSAEKPLKQTNLNFYLKVDNLLNVSYRDYMNRMRYFADDLGFSLTLGGTWEF